MIFTLIGPALLFVGPLLVWRLNLRHAAKSEAREREQKAYSDLLVASLGYSLRATTMLTTLKNRSGLREGVDVLMRLRRPIDTMQLYDWVSLDEGPLLDAWSRAWTYGSAEGVALANRLVDHCRDVMSLLGHVPATGLREKGRHLVLGIDTDRLAPERERRIRAVAVARRDLAEYMRTTTGRAPANLFSLAGPAETARRRKVRRSGRRGFVNGPSPTDS